MFHLVAGFLRDQGWTNWSVAQIETDSLVWWIFPPGASTPAMIGKLPRTSLDVDIARREAAALCSLSSVAGRLNVPRLLFQSELDDGRFLFLQSGLAGRPLADKGDHFDLILPWLDLFQTAIPRGGPLADEVRCAAALCRARVVELTPGESQLLSAAEDAAARLGSLAAVPVHGDFWQGNVLWDGERLAVMDWSNYHFGSPLEDLHNFAAAQGYESRGGAEKGMRSMWRVFFGDTGLRSRTREATARILEKRQISRELLRPLFLLFLVHRVACIEFSNHAAWRRFAAHYVEAGMPQPFDIAA
jgi:phosphotransferase family enzyme